MKELANEVTRLIPQAGNDGLLREFIAKGLWSAAAGACQEAISSREKQLDDLRDMETMLEDLVAGRPPVMEVRA